MTLLQFALLAIISTIVLCCVISISAVIWTYLNDKDSQGGMW